MSRDEPKSGKSIAKQTSGRGLVNDVIAPRAQAAKPNTFAYAGIGAVVGALLAGPVGAAFGGAIGGAIGAEADG